MAVLAVMTVGAQAADDSVVTGWQKSLVLDITTTQTAYSDSWVGGEAGSFNWVANMNGVAQKQMEEWFNFRSTLRLSFGQTMTQSTDTYGNKDWSKPKKSTDLIDWENLGRFTLHSFVDPYVAFRLETQFQDASVEAKKRYFSPLRLTESAGIAKLLYEKDKDQIVTRLGLAMRQTISSDIIDAEYNTESHTATDGGLESVTDANLSFHGNLKLTSKLTLFKALYFSDKDDFKGLPEEDYWKAVDVNWENTVTAQITKIIAVNFYTQLLYDKQVSKKGRFKETLGIGFIFTMI